MKTPKIAVVGTTRAGKSVFITVLAKHLEVPRDGARLAPRGGSPKNTYTQIEEWWNALQGGVWLSPTPPGTLIELNWDLVLVLKKKTIPLQMFDYAGETLTDLFNSKSTAAEGAARQYFDKVREAFESASVLLVLLNLESLIEQGVDRAAETKGTLITAMSAFLDKIKADKRDCRVCFVFTSYDRYESLIRQRWGSVQTFLEQEIPPLYFEVTERNPNVSILAVAAVGETETRVEPNTGKAQLYPKPGFKPKGFDKLVTWLTQATSEAKEELDSKDEQERQDEQNRKVVDEIVRDWKKIRNSSDVPRLDRFLAEARKIPPYPLRPNAHELVAQIQPLIDRASDMRGRLVKEERAERWKNFIGSKEDLQGYLVFGAIAVVGWFFLPTAVQTWEAAVKRWNVESVRRQQEIATTPIPTLIPGQDWTWQYTCNGGVFDCWEHRAVAKVPIRNGGGAGNITVTVTIGSQSQSQTHYFNKDEQAWVSVSFTKLPNHDVHTANVDFQAAR